jgi:hypothetical protein
MSKKRVLVLCGDDISILSPLEQQVVQTAKDYCETAQINSKYHYGEPPNITELFQEIKEEHLLFERKASSLIILYRGNKFPSLGDKFKNLPKGLPPVKTLDISMFSKVMGQLPEPGSVVERTLSGFIGKN